MNKIFSSALIICCCFGNRSEAQQHRYQPGVLFVWENNVDGRLLVPIAFIGEDSIYEPHTSGGDSLGDIIPLTIPKYESPYHRKDSTYAFYHDGKVMERFHVPDRDSSSSIDTGVFILENNEIEAEQIEAPWPPGIDSGLTLLGGSSCYFRDHEGYSEQPASPSVRKKILATCKRLFPKKWVRVPDSKIFVGLITLLQLNNDSTQMAFVTIWVQVKDGWLPFFAILRRSAGTFMPEFTQSDFTIGEMPASLGEVIGQCEIGEDGSDAVVVEFQGDENESVAIFQRQGVAWAKMYLYQIK